MMRRWFQRTVLSRLWLTFVVLGVSFFVFGAGTVNLGRLLMANAHLLADYGWQAVRDGGLIHVVPQNLLDLAASLRAG